MHASLALMALVLGLQRPPEPTIVVLGTLQPGSDSAVNAALAATLNALGTALRGDTLFAVSAEAARRDSLTRAAQRRGPYPGPARYLCAARALSGRGTSDRIQLVCGDTETGRRLLAVDRAMRRDFASTAAFLARQAAQALRADVLGARRRPGVP